MRIAAWLALLLPAGVIETRNPKFVVDDPLTAITLARGVLPAVVLLVLLVLTRTTPRPRGTREVLLAGYLTVVMASALWSLAPAATVLKAGHLAVAYGLVVMIARHWRDRRQAMDEIALVVYAVVAAAAIGAALFPERSTDTYGRLLSIFPALQPIVLGMFCALAVLMVCASAGPSHVFRRAPVRVLIAAASAGVLFLTGSRVPLALAVIAPLIYAWRSGHGRTVVRAALPVALALLALGFSPVGSALRPRLAPAALSDAVLNLGGRLPSWQAAFDVIADRPLIGFGYYAGHRLGQYADWFYTTPAYLLGSQLPYVDGTWIETALDLGLLGCVALAAFVGWSSVIVWRSARDRSPSGAAHLTLVMLALAYSLQDYTVQQVGYPLAVFATALLAPVHEAQRGRGAKIEHAA